MILKTSKKFIFAVEGETESYYLDWLRVQINNYDKALLNCADSKPVITKDPVAARRRLNVYKDMDYFYLIDKERYCDSAAFRNFLKKLKPQKGEKKIKFQLGYCNISFELWILLHKQSFRSSCVSQNDYLKDINRTFSTKFKSLDEYKKEVNFKKILSVLTLDDVKRAIRAAKRLQDDNNNTLQPKSFCGYSYFDENPSLSVHLVVEKILKDCGVDLN